MSHSSVTKEWDSGGEGTHARDPSASLFHHQPAKSGSRAMKIALLTSRGCVPRVFGETQCVSLRGRHQTALAQAGTSQTSCQSDMKDRCQTNTACKSWGQTPDSTGTSCLQHQFGVTVCADAQGQVSTCLRVGFQGPLEEGR